MIVLNLKNVKEPNETKEYKSIINKIFKNHSQLDRKKSLFGNESSETELKNELSKIPNIHFIDTDVDEFFSG